MKIVWILFIYCLFTIGCAPTYIQPSLEDSNQYFLEETINRLNVREELDGRINPKYNIALLSIENEVTLDKPIISMIEDQIISSLIKGGYTIVERDDDVIQNLIREGEKKYFLTYPPPIGNISNNQITENPLENELNIIETQLISAGILISYRILEAGIVYHDFPQDKEYEIRDAVVRLHIRIHKTPTGEIIHATNLNSTLSDTVRREFVSQLAAFHYSFFPYDYPLQEKKQYKEIKKIKSIKIPRKHNKSNTQTTTSSNRLSILPRIGYGMNYYNGIGIITGASISYGNNKSGEIGADLMYLIAPKLHTMGLTGFYARTILKYITLKGGISYLKTGETINIGVVAGTGLSFSIEKIFIIQPMAEINFGSTQNNILGINMNIKFTF